MASREVFVDSSAWLSLAFEGRTTFLRAQHRRVSEVFAALIASGSQFVTTDLTVAETHQLILIKAWRETGLAFLRAFPMPGVEVVVSSPDIERRALSAWIEPYRDRDFSLADAVSFVVMRDRGIRRALTLDRHFAAAGFEMLPG